jgi:regulator of protease activity HflC (stomatin/prohibitin superfamily)
MKLSVPNASKSVAKLVGVILLIVVVVNIFSFFVVVNPGERGILLQLGSVKAVYEPGLHFKIPLVNNVITMDVRTQKYEEDVDAASKDLQSIDGTVALNYHLDPASVDKVYQEIGKEYQFRIISPAIQESVKAATANYNAEELITKRSIVKEEIRKDLLSRLQKYNIVVEEFSIVNFSFSAEFDKSIEAKQTADQNALKAENDLRRIEIEAKQIVETAKAEAESIRIQGEALKQTPNLVQLKMVEAWNGQLPLYMGGGSQIISLPTVQ